MVVSGRRRGSAPLRRHPPSRGPSEPSSRSVGPGPAGGTARSPRRSWEPALTDIARPRRCPQVKLKDGRLLTGTFHCLDSQSNLILTNGVRPGRSRPAGRVTNLHPPAPPASPLSVSPPHRRRSRSTRPTAQSSSRGRSTCSSSRGTGGSAAPCRRRRWRRAWGRCRCSEGGRTARRALAEGTGGPEERGGRERGGTGTRAGPRASGRGRVRTARASVEPVPPRGSRREGSSTSSSTHWPSIASGHASGGLAGPGVVLRWEEEGGGRGGGRLGPGAEMAGVLFHGRPQRRRSALPEAALRLGGGTLFPAGGRNGRKAGGGRGGGEVGRNG